jgi:hypothetical protein
MNMRSPNSTARAAGILYLLSGLPGVFSYLYLPAAFLAPGDAVATARKIADAAPIYRLGILSDIVGQIFLILLALSLYDLLKDVDRKYARLMVALVAVGVAVQIASVSTLLAPLVLLSGADYWSVFTTPQLDALALFFLKLRGDALLISQVFWGLWLLPFGILVIRSGFFPRILGQLLIVACFGYVATSFMYLVLPDHVHPVVHFTQPLGALGEGVMIIWLLAKGARAPAPLAAN